MALSLESPAFKSNSAIPREHTCDGEDRSPPLAWSGAPKDAESFVLVCTDPDAPSGVFHHWAVYNLPAGATSLFAGYRANGMSGAAREAINDFRKLGYNGPCPPRGHGAHHYHFRLSTLRIPSLPLPSKATCRDVIEAARPHTIETAELIGLYER